MASDCRDMIFHAVKHIRNPDYQTNRQVRVVESREQ
jgi:hypothetical protein